MNSDSVLSRVLVVFVVCFLAGCGDADEKQAARDARAVLIADEQASYEERLAAMDGLRRPVTQDVVEALLLTMKDRSQQAFVTVPDRSPLKYHVAESPYGGPDNRFELRLAAVQALERLSEKQALPDLISALHDRHPPVRHQAARALWKLGSRQGLEVLLKGLEGKALSNESANRVLKQIAGRDFGFNTDAGWSNKLAAIEKWRAHASSMQPESAHPRMGEDADLDRRVRFLVAVLGQHQFLFMEQSRRALSQMEDLAVAHIRAGLDDPELGQGNQQLRAYAVQALTMNGSENAANLILERCVNDESAPVRSRAALSLGELDVAGAEESLMKLLEDEDDSVVVAAVQALGMRESGHAIEAVIRFHDRKDTTERGRLVAALSLVRMGSSDRRFPSHIEAVMTDGAPHLKAELADLLSSWQGELLGWDERKSASEQGEALARWRKILYR